ncbi:MAG: hypothetical protein IJ834_05245 [Paludibacteraceae bacterium]|nr:hypothetical protein [Paludibacteraceae bacterium]
MKTNIIFVAAMAIAITFTSCGFGKGATTSTSNNAASTTTVSSTDAVQMGKNAGNSLDQLTAQYKADGNKLDMTNLMNIANTLNLVAASQQFYNNKSNSEYRKNFVKGMVLNSINIDELNADVVTESLSDLVEQTNISELQAAAQKGEATAKEVEKTAEGIKNIINIFKK